MNLTLRQLVFTNEIDKGENIDANGLILLCWLKGIIIADDYYLHAHRIIQQLYHKEAIVNETTAKHLYEIIYHPDDITTILLFIYIYI